jgi:pimeloyl-ACP methyl ester carboxylesterase
MKATLILTCILLFTTSSFGQSIKIGSLKFSPLNNEKKPAETVHTTIQVFENNLMGKGRNIPLYIEVLPSKNKKNKKEPMFILMGGPGQAATDLVSFFDEIFKPINQYSDIVFIDQRGTGKSNPLKIHASYYSLQDYFNDEFVNDSIIRTNYSTLSKQNDLTKYGTLNATLDIETIRKAMGYSKINIYGTSYGTRLAVSYIKKFPSNVRTATLKGIVPDNLVIPYDFATDAQNSLDKVIADCESIDSCKKAFPKFSMEIKKLFSSKFPIKIELFNIETHQNEPVKIGKEVIATSLRVLLLSPSTTVTIPFLVTEANKGNYTPLANMIMTIKKSYIAGLYDGMSLCVTCFEDYPMLGKINENKFKNTFLGNDWIYRIQKPCAIWNSNKLYFPKKKITKLPSQILLISSERDPATPPKYGEELLKYFPDGKHLIIKQASHSFNGMTGCVENIICDFVKAGHSANLKYDCIDLIKFPGYKLR